MKFLLFITYKACINGIAFYLLKKMLSFIIYELGIVLVVLKSYKVFILTLEYFGTYMDAY